MAMTEVKPADPSTRMGLKRSFDYEPSWVNASFETFSGLTQQQFQDTVAPFQRHGAKIPVVVPPGWRRVETSMPGKHIYIHVETGTVSRFPKQVYSTKKESWLAPDGARIPQEELHSQERVLEQAYTKAKQVCEHLGSKELKEAALSRVQLDQQMRTGKVVDAVVSVAPSPAPAQAAAAAPAPAPTPAAEPEPAPKAEEPAKAAPAAAPAPAPAVSTEPPLPVAMLFPGQGSQYIGMMKDVKNLPAVKTMLNQCDDILNFSLLELCLEGNEKDLEETSKCQPALFMANAAAIEKLREDKPDRVERVQAVAGLSLGEYSALYAAGVFDFATGMRLVKKRGELMQAAAEKTPQRMASVAGLERKTVEELCVQATGGDPAQVCQIANVLFPNGFTVGGTDDAMASFEKLATDAKAMQVKALKTGGAFHTPLMKPAQAELIEQLKAESKNFRPPRCTVVMNTDATKIGPATPVEQIVELMGRQIVNPVEWENGIGEMVKDGVTEFYECGPQKQLKAMMKRISQEKWKSTTALAV